MNEFVKEFGIWVVASWVLFGVLLSLSLVKANEEGKLEFSWWSLALAFIFAGHMGMTAGGDLGRVTVRVAGSRDPEFESVEVRQVSDAKRWNRAESAYSSSGLCLVLGVWLSYAVIILKNRSSIDWKHEWATYSDDDRIAGYQSETVKFRNNCQMGAVFFYFVYFIGGAFQG